MPAAPSKKSRSKKTNALPEWKRMNLRSQLERQLQGVMESVPERESGPSDAWETKQIISPAAAPSVPPLLSSTRELDLRLVQKLNEAKSGKTRRLNVRVGDHEASPHIVEMGGLARKIEIEPREPVMVDVDRWLAPYEAPPSIDDLAAMASDLYLDRVAPSLWFEQFTPGDAGTAYREQFGLWSRLRAPLIRWESGHAVETDAGTVAGDDDMFAEQFRPDRDSWIDRTKHAFVEAFAKAKATEEEIVTETEQAWGAPVLVPRLAPARVMVGFVALLLLVSLPAGAVSVAHSLGASWGEITASGRAAAAAATSALAAGSSADSADWARVSESLEATDQALNRVNALAVAVSEALPSTRDAYQSARSVLHAGDASAQAASTLAEGLDRALTEPAAHPVDRLHVLETYLESALPLIDDADQSIHQVKADALPENERAHLTEAVTVLDTAKDGLREFMAINQLLISGIGDEHRKSYLLVFQNSTELRPTGGFMGSIAQVTLDRGDLIQLVVPGGGPYDLRDQLTTRAIPPAPLQLVASRWEFQDANWFPDFPAAASKIRKFWSEAGQPTIDGVIAINLGVMEKLLALTGPIDMPDYHVTVTADNFWLVTQTQVEVDYDKSQNTPKKFIGDLMPKVLDKLKALMNDKQNGLKLLGLVTDALQTKDIQVWFADADDEALAERLDWNGRFKEAPGDELAVIDTNIAGQKTDREIDERVLHHVQIAEDGSITDSVDIVRTHHGEKGAQFNGVNNVEYLRVYVPQGSQLLSADGFEAPSSSLFKKPLDGDPQDPDVALLETNRRTGPNGVDVNDEFGRTVFGGWVQLMPGETATTTFTYRLPFSAFDIAKRLHPDGAPAADAVRPAYMALYTSQSGKPNRQIVSDVHVPASWTSVWTSDGALGLDAVWDRDRATGGLFVTTP
ncbi:MAG TPA: DUF4012 domain-containing protein [Verrucomicrobiae bacterium]|nr:DUF4012 domain-containing protein [Verrucomicrobiae bacterium]